ncbi:IclR family transcriptional regulator [Alkalihalobacillus sp. BA299]|uniref:IclR family transcriptional regulator n=1 Tax=Alkalihalobacillus sp. BA299 TaxID=2815938 RepID=UPI001AD99E08|nr:IclR family transcriptional regulator [Alkalihalobacillus sp. BA299]
MLKTLDQSLKVLMAFTKDRPTWGARELAKELDLNATNVYRILATFEENRFLSKDPVTKKYSLGIKLWELGLLVHDNHGISEFIKPILEDLMEKTGESVFLTVLDGNEALTLDVVEPQDKVKFSVTIGSRAPLYVGASYRSILAFMPDEEINKIISGGLKAYTSSTIVDREQLRAELELIKEQGWARSEGEFTKDVIAIAVPLFYKDEVKASLTVSGPTYRITEEAIQYILIHIKEASAEIMKLMEKYQFALNKY